MRNELDETLYRLERSQAYVHVSLQNQNLRIEFYAPWRPDGIFLWCRHIHSYKIFRDPEQGEDSYFIGRVMISEDILQKKHAEGWNFNDPRNLLEKKVFVIEIEGTVNIEVVCLDISWEGVEQFISNE